jgi:hypothetical protein
VADPGKGLVLALGVAPGPGSLELEAPALLFEPFLADFWGLTESSQGSKNHVWLWALCEQIVSKWAFLRRDWIVPLQA